MRDRTFLAIVGVAAAVLAALAFFAGTARADHRVPPENSLFVDTAVYLPTEVTPGGTYHYETPETNPNVAFLLNHEYDHVWMGNGSEHLPCEGGIHWIANKNVLTVSNCLDSPSTTTTTVPPTTTTTAPKATTTTDVSTTTTIPVPTSSVPTTVPVPPTSSPTTTSIPASVPSTSTSVPTVPTTSDTPSETPPTLPYTGMEDQVPLAVAAAGAILLGTLLVRRKED